MIFWVSMLRSINALSFYAKTIIRKRCGFDSWTQSEIEERLLQPFFRLVKSGPTITDLCQRNDFKDSLYEDSNHQTIMKQLMEDGADLTVRTNSKETLLHLAFVSVHRLPFLLQRGAGLFDIDARDKGSQTPPHHAAAVRNVSTMEALIQPSAKFHAKDSMGATMLHYCIGCVSCIDLAVGAGLRH